MDALCRIQLLGDLSVQQGDRKITRFRTQKTGSLLAYLAYHRHRRHPREVLMELLWPEDDLEASRASLRVALSSLRHQLEPPGVPTGAVLVADRLSVGLNPSAVVTDASEFGEAMKWASHARSAAERAQCLADAVELYRGPLLPGYYEEWIVPEHQRLAELYLQALRQLTAHREQTGDLDGALACARRAVSADPLREETQGDLMRLLAALGQASAALEQYRELERVLKEQLGAAPSSATRVLAQKIQLQAGAVGSMGSVGSVGSMGSVRTSHTSHARPAASIPAGTVTFLLTDIEGSTALWERTGDAFRAALETHHQLLREQFRLHHGYQEKEAGDGFLVAFSRPSQAIACAIACQRALERATRSLHLSVPMRVRMAVHTGEVDLKEGEYHGLVLHRAARMLMAAHGGQILCSEATAGVLWHDASGTLDGEVRLVDLGVYRLRDAPGPQHLFQVTYPGMPCREFPPLNAAAGYSGNLPRPATRFFGRVGEIAQLVALLAPTLAPLPPCPAAVSRLVTLTGPGGSGKTRLALEAAQQLLEAFDGATWYVPLADATDSRLLVDAIATSLRVPRSPHVELLDQVVEALCGGPGRPFPAGGGAGGAAPPAVLLVLDNFEQVVDDGAAIVRTLLDRAPGLRCLVTSRRTLDLVGEREFPVPPLPTPESAGALEQLAQVESVQVFLDRAQVARPDFQLTTGNAAAVAQLCQRLEGIPLALELAAARAQVLTPAQMLRQMERRFEFLVSRRRDAGERHQTLWAATDWSYQLLPPDLQRFFARLSIFRGGWTMEAAEAVAGEQGSRGAREPGSKGAPAGMASHDWLPPAPLPPCPPALDSLEHLRQCSLVLAEPGADGAGEMRFRMLETLREFAGEQVPEGEREALARRHAEHCLSMVEQGGPVWWRLEESAWLDRMEAEHENLRAALAWCFAVGSPVSSTAPSLSPPPDRLELGMRLAAGLWRFWHLRGFLREGEGWLTRALGAAAGAAPGLRAGILSGLGTIEWMRGNYRHASDLHTEALALYREAGDLRSAAFTLNNIAVQAEAEYDWETSIPLYEESLALYRRLEDPWGIGFVLNNLGLQACRLRDYQRAALLLEESLALARARCDAEGVSNALINLGEVALRTGDLAAARSRLRECLSTTREMGYPRGIAASFECVAECAALSALAVPPEPGRGAGRLAKRALTAGPAAVRAARLFGAAEALRETIGAPMEQPEWHAYMEYITSLQAALGDEAFAVAAAEGRAMTLEQAFACALEECGDEA